MSAPIVSLATYRADRQRAAERKVRETRTPYKPHRWTLAELMGDPEWPFGGNAA